MVAVLREAAEDLRYFLNREYPREPCLTLVGNRYQLDRTAREMLRRGVFSADLAAARQEKILSLHHLAGRPLGIDGHNVLITLESAIKGLPLVMADDGFIRDVARLSRAYRQSRRTAGALDLMAQSLARAQVGAVSLWFDAPMSKSGELARRAGEILKSHGLEAAAQAVPVPERELLTFPGPIASRDTHLIDAREEVVDLAGEIIFSDPALCSHLVSLL